jgi:hypothetical protein
MAAVALLGKNRQLLAEGLRFTADANSLMGLLPDISEEEAAQALRQHGQSAIDYAAVNGRLLGGK